MQWQKKQALILINFKLKRLSIAIALEVRLMGDRYNICIINFNLNKKKDHI